MSGDDGSKGAGAQYLIDKQGRGDDDLVALEGRLQSARYQPRQWEAPPKRRTRSPVWPMVAAMAASLLAFAYVIAPRGPTLPVTTASGTSQLAVGRWLETNELSTIAVANIGQVTVEPSSRVRIVETSEQQHRLELAQGALHAKVAAPPRLFVVDTPAAKAVDLGCEYRLSVDAAGATRLEVLTGEVSLEGQGASSRVSAGSVCITEKGKPPGVPRSVRATDEFLAALDAWENGGPVEPVAENARIFDAVTLWNLMERVKPEERDVLLARLAMIRQLPETVKKDDFVQLQPAAMESLWNACQ